MKIKYIIPFLLVFASACVAGEVPAPHAGFLQYVAPSILKFSKYHPGYDSDEVYSPQTIKIWGWSKNG